MSAAGPKAETPGTTGVSQPFSGREDSPDGADRTAPRPDHGFVTAGVGHYDHVAAARSSDGSGPLRRAARAMGRALRAPFTGAARGIRKATHAHGAGESGLGKLIELHAVNGAGDVMITVALASTVFFSVPTDEARGRVALYLAVTMAPFTLLAPVVGPLLDRLPHGRRAAMKPAPCSRGPCSRSRCPARWPRAAWSSIRRRWASSSAPRRTGWCAAPWCRACCHRASPW